jgi:hypothetical protein
VDLAAAGRERHPFKTDVRKHKELGLTESLEVGYRLSPRGRALLARLGDRPHRVPGPVVVFLDPDPRRFVVHARVREVHEGRSTAVGSAWPVR